MKPSMFSAR